MGSKTLQIHCYKQTSQEQSSWKVNFQVLISKEIVRYRWRENIHFSLSAYFSNSPRCYIMGKFWLLWVFRLLENAFAAIADLMLSDTDRHTKPKPQSPSTFMQISLYIILLTRNSIPSKIAFPWSHLHLYNCLRSSYYNCCDFAFKKVSSSIQRDTPWCLKSM